MTTIITRSAPGEMWRLLTDEPAMINKLANLRVPGRELDNGAVEYHLDPFQVTLRRRHPAAPAVAIEDDDQRFARALPAVPTPDPTPLEALDVAAEWRKFFDDAEWKLPA